MTDVQQSLLVNIAEGDADPQGKGRGDVAVLRDEAKRYNTLKWVGAILLGVFGIAQIVLAVATSHHFALELNTTTDFRHGEKVGEYPATVLEVLGTINNEAVYAIATLLAALGYVLLLFVHKDEISELSRGSDGYAWVSFMLGHIPLWLAVMWTAGISNVWQFVLGGLIVFLWLGILLLGDLINQGYYREAMKRYGGYTWSWAFFVIATLAIVVFYVYLYWFTATTFSADNAPHSSLLSVPITMGVLYLIFLLFILLHYVEVSWLRKSIDAIFALHIINLIIFSVVPWLAFIIFWCIDGVIPVPPPPIEI